MITVYVKPNVNNAPPCVQCDRTVEYLTDQDVPFEVVEIDGEIRQLMMDKGYRQVPIVSSPHGEFAGLDWPVLKSIVEKEKADD